MKFTVILVFTKWLSILFSNSSCNMLNTRDSVSSEYPNTEKSVENSTRSGVFLTEIRGVWITGETLSRVFDMSSQSKQSIRSKRRNKIVKKLC